ncbi:MAG: metallophosphoesterase [Ignavibacteriales bacterium]|nr:metallophosphoesterase [Ignavibacteriales bacterium]
MKLEPANSNQRTSRILTRREFMRLSAVGLSGAAFLGAAPSGEDDLYEIVEQTICLRNLHPDMNGLTIGMMSDVHSGKFMAKAEMAEYVAAMNALKTDVIMLPGDFVTSKIEEVYPFVEAFSELKAPLGIFACMGNHEYYAGAESVAKEINATGISLLRDSAFTLKKGSGSLTVAGIEDVGWNKEPRKNLERALAHRAADSPVILLCHKPYYIDLAVEHNVDLTLSGHTHGGQIVFTKIGGIVVAPASLFSKYVAGLYRKEGAQLYVTRGIGTIGVPVRFNCPPEITKIVLKRTYA